MPIQHTCNAGPFLPVSVRLDDDLDSHDRAHEEARQALLGTLRSILDTSGCLMPNRSAASMEIAIRENALATVDEDLRRTAVISEGLSRRA